MQNIFQETLSQFRELVYQVFGTSRDAAFELIDAIASSPNARSAVEVSESALMERNYASVYKGLEVSNLQRVQPERSRRCWVSCRPR